jgi:hypothetical protein
MTVQTAQSRTEGPLVSDTHEAHRAKPLSWVMVAVITIGTIVGTFGVCLASWPISIIGVAVVVLGAVIALATGIMEDVDESASRDLWPIGGRDRREIA